MAEVNAQPDSKVGGESCEAAESIDALNRACHCLTLDEEALRRGLEADLGTRGLSQAMVQTHPHLFASVPMFVSREHVERMARLIGAVEAVVATPHFRRAALCEKAQLSDAGVRDLCRTIIVGQKEEIRQMKAKLAEFDR